MVDALHRTVGRNGEDVEVVDVVELGRVGLRRSGHAAELGVEAEVVLNGDRGEGLRFRIDLHAFLGFHRLVKTVAPAASGHFSSGLLIDDDHLVFLNDVLVVLLVEAVGAEELADLVDALPLMGKAILELVLFVELLFVSERGVAVDL